jgi:hypothetical protein
MLCRHPLMPRSVRLAISSWPVWARLPSATARRVTTSTPCYSPSNRQLIELAMRCVPAAGWTSCRNAAQALGRAMNRSANLNAAKKTAPPLSNAAGVEPPASRVSSAPPTAASTAMRHTKVSRAGMKPLTSPRCADRMVCWRRRISPPPRHEWRVPVDHRCYRSVNA